MTIAEDAEKYREEEKLFISQIQFLLKYKAQIDNLTPIIKELRRLVEKGKEVAISPEVGIPTSEFNQIVRE